MISLATHLRKAIPHSSVTIIKDEDVHNGYIFTSNNNNISRTRTATTSNVYDMLIMTQLLNMLPNLCMIITDALLVTVALF